MTALVLIKQRIVVLLVLSLYWHIARIPFPLLRKQLHPRTQSTFDGHGSPHGCSLSRNDNSRNDNTLRA